MIVTVARLVKRRRDLPSSTARVFDRVFAVRRLKETRCRSNKAPTDGDSWSPSNTNTRLELHKSPLESRCRPTGDLMKRRLQIVIGSRCCRVSWLVVVMKRSSIDSSAFKLPTATTLDARLPASPLDSVKSGARLQSRYAFYDSSRDRRFVVACDRHVDGLRAHDRHVIFGVDDRHNESIERPSWTRIDCRGCEHRRLRSS